jgi:O-antigen/teichoic acid export membrane protein
VTSVGSGAHETSRLRPTRPVVEAEAPQPAQNGHDTGSFAYELRLLTRGSWFGFAGQAANAFLAFGFSLAVGRLFHAQGTGTFFEAMAIFTIASNVGDLGADDGLNWSVPRLRTARRYNDIRRLLPIAFVPVLVVSSLFALFLFVYAVPIAHLFTHGHNETHLSSFIRILCPFVPVAALVEVLIAGTRGFDRVWPLAAIWSVIMPACRLLLLPVLLVSGLGILAVAYSWSVPIVLGGAAMLWTLWMFLEKEHRAGASPASPERRAFLAREFWRFSAPRGVASICAMALVWLDVLLVGYIISMRMAGIYGVANRYLVVVTFALAAVGGTIGPQVSRLLSLGRVAEVRRLYQAATAWVMAVAWPLALSLALFSPFFMRLFGREFAEGATALSILALMMLYVSATGNNMVMLVMSGKTSTSLWVGVVTLAINVAANLALIPRLGINGAALAWALSLLVSNGLITVILYRRLRLHPVGPAFLPVMACSVLLVGLPALAFRLAFGTHWAAILATAVVGGGAYAYSLWRLRERLELRALSAALRQ